MVSKVVSSGTTGVVPASRLPSAAASYQRNRSRVAAGGLLLATCSLGAVVAFGKVGDRQAILAMARTVEIGEVVEPGDLRIVHVSSDPSLRAVPAADRSRIVGRPAAVRLSAGSLLSPDEMGAGAGLPEGMALVGAVLKAGQFPLGLAIGDTVALVAAPASGTGIPVTGEGFLESPTATVVAVELAADASGATAVSLQLPAGAAQSVAGAGAAGRLNLVVVNR